MDYNCYQIVSIVASSLKLKKKDIAKQMNLSAASFSARLKRNTFDAKDWDNFEKAVNTLVDDEHKIKIKLTVACDDNVLIS